MLRNIPTCRTAAGVLAIVLSCGIGCSRSTTTTTLPAPANQPSIATADPPHASISSTSGSSEHAHTSGVHGGTLVSLGRDSYHVEAIVTSTGELRLYTLGSDETRVVDIEIQELVAYVKPARGGESESVLIAARPQPGDVPGKASLFVAQLPAPLVGQTIEVTVPNITIGGERFRLTFSTQAPEHFTEAVPAKVTDAAERALYLTPGGAYTQADIEANGNRTASQKFVTFQASHDLKPNSGDKICPVTLTKANAKCTWIVAGKTYQFCCPPCIDEFVTLAKTKPEAIKVPEDYVQRAATKPQ